LGWQSVQSVPPWNGVYSRVFGGNHNSTPKAPQGRKNSADVIGNAVLVMKIAAGERVELDIANGKNRTMFYLDSLQKTGKELSVLEPGGFHAGIRNSNFTG
jgi:hypothetical protein